MSRRAQVLPCEMRAGGAFWITMGKLVSRRSVVALYVEALCSKQWTRHSIIKSMMVSDIHWLPRSRVSWNVVEWSRSAAFQGKTENNSWAIEAPGVPLEIALITQSRHALQDTWWDARLHLSYQTVSVHKGERRGVPERRSVIHLAPPSQTSLAVLWRCWTCGGRGSVWDSGAGISMSGLSKLNSTFVRSMQGLVGHAMLRNIETGSIGPGDIDIECLWISGIANASMYALMSEYAVSVYPLPTHCKGGFKICSVNGTVGEPTVRWGRITVLAVSNIFLGHLMVQ